MINILITLVIAIIGGLVAKKIGIPAPFMLGALIAVAILSVSSDVAYMPSEIKNFTQAITGIYIGMRLRKKDLKGLKSLISPAIVLVVGFMVFTFLMGLCLNWLYSMDFATAFLVSIPGGAVDVSLMAYDLNADPLVVSLIQVFRMSTVLLIFPTFIGLYKKKHNDDYVEPFTIESEMLEEDTIIDKLIPDKKIMKYAFTLLVGLFGGYIGYLIDLPAGCLSMSMIFTSIMHVNSKRVDLPLAFRWGAQVFAGAIVGSGVTLATIIGIKATILPAITVMIGYIVANYIISYLMYKTGKVDRITAMFASSPGGASELSLIAVEIGGESPKIAILQIIRRLSAVTLFPILVKILLMFL